jgi:hypothetical protein
MDDRNIPTPISPRTSGQTLVRLRPAVQIAALALILGGAIHLILYSMGLISTLLILIGIGTFLFARFLKREVDTLIDENNRKSIPSGADQLKELRKYISKTQYLENVGSWGEKASEQFAQICERHKSFQDLLLLKFGPNEITYARYHSAAEQTYLSVLDRLREVATVLNSINPIHPKEINAKLQDLAKLGDSPQSVSEVSSLNERKLLWERQTSRIDEILALNEKAITEFDRVTSALSETRTQRGESNQDLDSAMAHLRELAERAKKYDISS